MGEGQDKVANSLLDLEPTAILDLFLVYPDYSNKQDEVFAIHNGSIFKKGVVWQGRTYMPIGLEIDGFESNADGRINRPKIKISNKDYFVTSLLKKFDNFQSARVLQKRTFVKYLDDENFDGGNPFGQPNKNAEISSQQYIVAQKTQENKIFVEFELTSPLDLDNFQLNSRRIMGKYCYWKYRGVGCQYQGQPIHKENGANFSDKNGDPLLVNDIGSFIYGDLEDEYSNDKQYSAGDIAFIRSQNASETNDNVDGVGGSVYNYYIARADVIGLRPDENLDYWERDGCNKKLSSCKLHFPAKGGKINRFVGLGSVNVDSASHSPDAVRNYYLRQASFEGVFGGGTEKIKVNNTIVGQNKWTLAFNLKNTKALRVRNYIFQTTFGPEQNLQLFIENNSFYFEFKDTKNGAVGDLRYIFTPTRAGFQEQDGLKNHPIIVGQKNNKTMFLSEPSVNFYREFTLKNGMWKGGIGNFFIGEGTSTSPYSPMIIDSVCFWTKALSKGNIESLYNKVTEGGLRAKTYSQLQEEGANSLLSDVGNWWEGAFVDDTELNVNYNPKNLTEFRGIRDKGPYQDDLFFNREIAKTYFKSNFKIDNNTYQYNIEEKVTVKESNRYLPFGGFPGTDGFDFTREA